VVHRALIHSGYCDQVANWGSSIWWTPTLLATSLLRASKSVWQFALYVFNYLVGYSTFILSCFLQSLSEVFLWNLQRQIKVNRCQCIKKICVCITLSLVKLS
jgi:hypothetical protein